MKLKITTFNVRVDVDRGANDFENRKSRIIEFIKSEKPHIIGFQEATDHMRSCFRRELSEYTFIGCGRDAGYRGESVAIAYRTEEFELISLKNVWLSDTPSIPGSRYEDLDQSHCPRMFTLGLFKHRECEHVFAVVNTHLDHEGEKARLVEAEQMMRHLEGYRCPCVLMGDFNAEPSSEVIDYVINRSDRRLDDCTAGLAGSFHGFGVLEGERMLKIDYVFTDLPFEISETVLHEDEPKEGTYMSDHRPISVFVDVV